MGTQRVFKFPLFNTEENILGEPITTPTFVFPVVTSIFWKGNPNLREYQNFLAAPNLRTVWTIQNVFLSFSELNFTQSAAVTEKEWVMEFVLEINGQPAYVYIINFVTPALPENIAGPKLVISSAKSVVLEAYTTTDVIRAAPILFTVKLKGPEATPGGLLKAAQFNLVKPKLEVVLDQEYEPRNFSHAANAG